MGAQERGLQVENHVESDRRRDPRVEVSKRIAGQVGSAHVPVIVLNVSLGGLLIQAPVDYPPGETLEFRLTVAEGEPIVIRVRVQHTMRATSREGTSYISGVEFVDRGTPGCDQALKSLFSLLR